MYIAIATKLSASDECTVMNTLTKGQGNALGYLNLHVRIHSN